MKQSVIELTVPQDFRQWFAVLNCPDLSRPWISSWREYVPGTKTDPYLNFPDPGLN